MVVLMRKQVYGLVATLLVVCLSLSIFFSIQFSVNASVEEQNPMPTATPNPPTPTPTTQPSETPTCTSQPTPTATPTLMTEEEALAIATPLIDQYAAENNRTITSIKATFISNMKDMWGARGGPSAADALVNRTKVSTYPAWMVESTFEWQRPHLVTIQDENGTVISSQWVPDPPIFVDGFDVGIWADNHQIFYSAEQGFY
jgi:hypothetical protein